jgi:hypothetical protein
MASLEERVAALEARLGMESGLAASRDRDLSDVQAQLRSHSTLLRSVALTQMEHSQQLGGLERAVDAIWAEHGHLLRQITAMLDELIARGGGSDDADSR